MNNSIISLLQEKPIVVPRILFNNYRKLNITEEELVIVMLIISLGNNIEYNLDIFVNELQMDRHKVMELVYSLVGKNILSIDVVKNGRKTGEYISLSLLYDKLVNIIIDSGDNNNSVKLDDSLFSVFEDEFGRLLSPMEIEQIKEWITTYKNEDLIKAALRETVLNGANNLRYIDKILNDWNKKGYKNREDILRDRENYRKKKQNIEVFDTDWLNDE